MLDEARPAASDFKPLKFPVSGRTEGICDAFVVYAYRKWQSVASDWRCRTTEVWFVGGMRWSSAVQCPESVELSNPSDNVSGCSPAARDGVVCGMHWRAT